MNRKGKRLSVKFASVMVAGVMSVGLFGSAISVSAANHLEMYNLSSAGKFYTDYATLDEAKAAATELNQQIAAEGNVLLKNSGILPMSTGNYVSVFGCAEDNMTGGQGSVSTSLMEAGFKVNPTLKAFYASRKNTIRSETTDFGAQVENSLSLYNDAAVVVFARAGGEGSDQARVTGEENDDSKNINGWEHENLGEQDGKTYQHQFMLSNSENALLDYVTARFNKVIVVLNTSSIMEMYNLQNDDRIGGILLIQRPGNFGVSAVGKILSGEVNPSGKTGDEWYRDFSADPTWMNFSNNNQVGSTNTFSYNGQNLSAITGISYEEGIYVGYKYYETVYAEIAAGSIGTKDGKLVAATAEGALTGAEAAQAWWNENVVYPFGFGLSYTTFESTMGDIYVDAALKTKLGATVEASAFNSSVGNKAQYDKLYVPVTITNIGIKAGKQVAQVYVTAPYTAGGIEKSYVKLVGYAKTDLLQPGASQTLVVSFNVQDFASFDYTDANENTFRTYELDKGTYEVKLMADAHNEIAKKTFELGGTAVLAADDFSGNSVAATDFSNPNSEYYTLIGKDVKFSAAETEFAGKNLYDETAEMTILSRADMVGTFPKPHTASDYVSTKELLEYIDKYCDLTSPKMNDTTSKWALTTEQIESMANWAQASASDVAARENGYCSVLLREMAGVPLYDEEGNVTEAWVNFMNQLSFAEITRIITQCSQSSPSIASVGKVAARNIDGPIPTAGFNWQDETCLADTWNTELAHKMGITVANLYTLNGYTTWYAPAVNLHRSPFGGRNYEYYSSDGIHAGYMAIACASGCESRGVNCYIKHFALNDQETNRTNILTFVDEQNMRENYLIPFQMSVQEGGGSGLMLTFSRIGVVASPANHVLVQEIARDEWGFEGAIGTDFFPYRQSAYTITETVDGEQVSTKYNAGRTSFIDLMIRIGGVHPLGNDNTMSAYWSEDLNTVVYKNAEGAEVESKTDWYYARIFAMRLFYTYANSVNIENGVIFGDNFTPIYRYVDRTRQPQPATMTKELDAATVGTAYTANLAATQFELGAGNTATYAVTNGELPAGMTLNQSTGALSGTPIEAGNYSFTVRATSGISKGDVNITLTVNQTITATGEKEIALGEAFDILVDRGTIAADSFTYSATGLPAGVTIDKNSGAITGEPEEAGEYAVTVTIAATTGTGKNAVKRNYNYALTLKVTGGEQAPALTEERVAQLIAAAIEELDIPEEGLTEAQVEAIVQEALANYTVTVKDGVDGKDGKDGANGQNGKDGVGIKGITSKAIEGGTEYTVTFTDDRTPYTFTIKDGATVEANGCGGVIGIGGGILAVLTLLGVAAVARKKED